MKELISKLTIKATSMTKLASYPFLMFVFQYTGVNKEVSSILAILFLLDVITAVVRQLVISPKTFSSKVGIIGIVSKLLTFCIPFILAIVGKGAGVNMTDFVNISMQILIIYEGWSVISNIGQIRAKDVTIPEYDAVSLLIRRIQQLFRTLLTQLHDQDTKQSEEDKEVEDFKDIISK